MAYTEDDLAPVLARNPPEQKDYITAEFWKRNFMKLHLEYEQLAKEFADFKATQLLPHEIDDGK